MSKQLQAKRGVTPQELQEVGLTQPRGTGRGGAYDRFRERIIFPIRDQAGNAVGPRWPLPRRRGRHPRPRPEVPQLAGHRRSSTRAGRSTSSTGRRARSGRRGQAVIVEGYTDALMAHQAGFDNVVASLGTALTPGQVALLTRYAKKVALAYDVDPAGQSAGTFGVTELNNLIAEVQAAALGLVERRRRPDRRRGRPAARGQGSRRGHPRVARHLARGGPDPRPDPRLPHRLPRLAGRRPHGRGPQAARRRGPADAAQGRRPDGPRHLPPAPRPALDGQRADPPRGAPSSARAGSLGRAPVGGGAGGAASTPAPGSPWTRSGRRPSRSAPRRSSKSITPVEVELLRLILLIPDQQARVEDVLRPEELPSTVARELYGGDPRRSPARSGGRRRPRRRRSLRARPLPRGARPGDPGARARAVRPRPARPAGAAVAAGRLQRGQVPPHPRGRSARGAERLEPGGAGRRRAPRRPRRRWLASSTKKRQINEARRSLDRRIEQTRLLTRPAAAAGAPASTAGTGRR